MLQSNNIITFSQYQGINIKNIEHSSTSIVINAEQNKELRYCPECKHETALVHDYRTQTIKDIPYGEKSVCLVLKKRRLVCPVCGKRFIQTPEFLQSYGRMTKKLIEYIVHSLREIVTFKHVAKHSNVSVYTVRKIFQTINYSIYKLPKILAIDEFKGNAGGEKYQAIITNPAKKKVLDICPNREKQELREYFRQFTNRKNVEFFIMDMWRPYKELCEEMFPNAKICIDKYHYVRQVFWAFERVRKGQQQLFDSEKRLYFKRSKALLWKDYDKLDEKGKDRVRLMLERDEKIDQAWQLKELFINFKNSTSRADAKIQLDSWIKSAKESGLEEFNEVINTLTNWEKYILNTVEYGYTNGFTEGINNKIKVIKRVSFGYRNFEIFRNRILHACNQG